MTARSYLLSLGLCCLAGSLLAAEPAIAARVGEQSITSQDLQRELTRAVPNLPEDAAVVAKLKDAMLRECVDRELALQALIAQQQAASHADVDLEIRRRQQELEKSPEAWPKFLAQAGHTEASYRRETLWRLSWSRYLIKQTSDANLERYFQKHAADFDGTEVRVAHILWKVSDTADTKERAAVLAQAAALRAAIVAGQTTFTQAAARHSQAPTAAAGGDIGFIGRHRPMPEAFSSAAFALRSGEVSPPVESTFGVHLIHCTEIKPGNRPWTDARDELRAAVTRYLFEWLSQKQARLVKVDYATPETEPR